MIDQPAPPTDDAATIGRTRIKICGITSSHMVNIAADAGADAIGFVLVPDSPRHITMERAESIRRIVPPFVSPIAVFQDDDPMRIVSWPGTWVQLHGNECEEETALPQSVIKAIPFDPAEIQRWDRCRTVAALLIDAPEGGSGESFDHDALAELMSSIRKPVIIAGGLTPENVGPAISIVRPYGVDVSSGVESSRGVKDATLIREFCAAVREADA